jgi:hypothetical protein
MLSNSNVIKCVYVFPINSSAICELVTGRCVLLTSEGQSEREIFCVCVGAHARFSLNYCNSVLECVKLVPTMDYFLKYDFVFCKYKLSVNI